MFGLPVALCITFSIITIENVESNSKSQSSIEEYDKKVKIERTKFYKYKQNIERQAILDAPQSTNEYIRAVGVSHEQYSNANNLVSSFLKVYLTWNNSKEYQERSSKLLNLITPELATNKTVFDNGKDTTGGNYIKSLGLKSIYLSSKSQTTTETDNDNLIVLTKATQKSWYGSDVSKSGDNESYYKFTINTKENKITDLQILSSSVNPIKD